MKLLHKMYVHTTSQDLERVTRPQHVHNTQTCTIRAQ